MLLINRHPNLFIQFYSLRIITAHHIQYCTDVQLFSRPMSEVL